MPPPRAQPPLPRPPLRRAARLPPDTCVRHGPLTTRDLEQIALQVTGHARAVASDVRRRAGHLQEDSGPRALADVVLRVAEGRLSVPIEGTMRCVHNRARLVRARYERLDRLEAAPVTRSV